MPRYLVLDAAAPFCQSSAANGADLPVICKVLVHIDLLMSKICPNVENERLIGIHKQFHPRA
ncbi:MAG: hypothetical protein E7052_11185 [Lentisphaerae bacterium]|nr:hypothetical protein [Lentisphaerota bacterium]